MNLEAHRAMRREQIERWLAADGMGVVEWRRLNRMATSTFYLWLNGFREKEPEVFGERPAKGWIEVAKQAKKDSVAPAVGNAAGAQGKGWASPAHAGSEPITVSIGGAVISIPAGSGASDIENAVRLI